MLSAQAMELCYSVRISVVWAISSVLRLTKIWSLSAEVILFGLSLSLSQSLLNLKISSKEKRTAGFR
jgi:hypothetical protein